MFERFNLCHFTFISSCKVLILFMCCDLIVTPWLLIGKIKTDSFLILLVTSGLFLLQEKKSAEHINLRLLLMFIFSTVIVSLMC